MFLIQCTGLWDIGTIQLKVRSEVRLKRQAIVTKNSSNSK